jgi:Flp pilus assembly protein TadG
MSAGPKAERRSTNKRFGLFGRFRRNDAGATAIEFGLLALPFSLLIFAVFESCISFAGQQVLSNITDDLARQLRTGELKAADTSPGEIRDTICRRLEIIVAKDCPGLSIDLRQYDTFAEAAKVRVKIVGKVLDESEFGFDPGLAGTKNMLRVFYKWPVMTDFLRKSMANLDDGKTLIFTTTTWQNEPFDDTSNLTQ